MNVFEKMIVAIISAVFRVIGLLSPAAARTIAALWFRIDGKHRRIAIANLTRALGPERSDAEIRSLALDVFENITRILCEIGWSFHQRREDLQRYVEIRDVQHVRTALAKGKGVLVLTAHIGNWELMAAISPILGIPVHALYRPLDFKPLDLFFVRHRSRFGANMIPSAHGMRKILRSLRNGEAVTMLMDQNVDWYEGVFVDFFGRRACTNKGLALLAMKTGAPVVPVFLVRENGRFVAEFCEEVPLAATGDRTNDIELTTLRYNQAIEAAVRRHPDQWLWVHQRWKTRPDCPWPAANRGMNP